jgi:putative ABC transport system ATP-binding protein
VINTLNLHKIYGHGSNSVHALKGVELQIETGEFVAVMGRSGSGKSTLLRILGLLDEPSQGDIFVDGINIAQLPERKKAKFRLNKFGFVFQEHSLVSELTVLENVYLPAICSSHNNEYIEYARGLLEVVGLADRLQHYPGEISGGEQQRVAVARSIINKPKILFADEPTASLDEESSRVVLELFTKLNRDMEQTIVMVTHEPEDRKYVHRVIHMRSGSIDRGGDH